VRLENKNVLITGISGFVDSHLAKFWLDRKATVFGLLRRRADGSRPKNLVEKGILDEVKLIEGDITDITAAGFALKQSEPDIIFHPASQSFVPMSFINPLATLEAKTCWNYKFAFAPDAVVYWKARSNLKGVFKQHYLYVKGKGKAKLPLPLLLYLRYFVGIFLAVLSLIYPITLIFLVLALILYIIIYIKITVGQDGLRKLPIYITLIFLIDIAIIVGYTFGRMCHEV